MDKFSLYDFMSYFLPGVISLYIIRFFAGNFYMPDIFSGINFSFLQITSDFEKGLTFSIAAILLGLLNHRITFWLLKFKWYKKIIVKPIITIVNENKEDIKADHSKLKVLLNTKEEENLFDDAYYYLEFKNRISAAKSFQSMYFFLRNLITLLLMVLPVTLVVIFLTIHNDWKTFLFFFTICIFGIILLAWMGRWYREKMVIKVYKTCLIALTTDNKTNENEE